MYAIVDKFGKVRKLSPVYAGVSSFIVDYGEAPEGHNMGPIADWVFDGDLVKVTYVPNKIRSLEEEKKLLIDAITSNRYRLQTGGVRYNGYRYLSDSSSVSLMASKAFVGQQLISKGKGGEIFCRWKTKDGWVEHTPESLIALVEALDAFTQECFDNEKALTDSIEGATTFEELHKIDIHSGWPDPVIG